MADNDVLENVLDPVGQPSGIFGRVSDPTSKNTGVVHDPNRQPTQDLASMEGQLMASRLDSLEGKVVYLVETGFHGAKNLKEQEGFNTREEFRQWILERLKKPGGPFMRPASLNLVVVGGEWNPMFTTTDFIYTQTVSVDKWIPKGGIRMEARPIRMPAPVTCKNGSCGI